MKAAFFPLSSILFVILSSSPLLSFFLPPPSSLLSVCPQAAHIQVFGWQAPAPLSNFLLPVATVQRAKRWCMFQREVDGHVSTCVRQGRAGLGRAGQGWARLGWVVISPSGRNSTPPPLKRSTWGPFAEQTSIETTYVLAVQVCTFCTAANQQITT